MVNGVCEICKLKKARYLSELFTGFSVFFDHERAPVIHLLHLLAPVRQRFFQSADRPGADPKTAVVLIDRN